MRKLLLTWAALSALVLILVPGAPAGARTVRESDPAGDGPSVMADILSTGVDVTGDYITVYLTGGTDPRSWFGESAAVWDLDTTGDEIEEFYVALFPDNVGNPPQLLGGVYDLDGNLLCDVDLGVYQGIFVGFDAACVDNPDTLAIRTWLTYDSPNQAWDVAPSETQMCCRWERQSGYWMLDLAGNVSAFGDAQYLRDISATDWLGVDIAPMPTGEGYWILDEQGGVTPFGIGVTFGDVRGSLAEDEEAVSMSATPSGRGYWIFTQKGNAFPFGDAEFFGDVGHLQLNGPVLDSVATPTGEGYRMVASDGGIFSFGDAKFYGSMGGTKLNQPVMSMAPTTTNRGYWLVSSDGGIFAFGDARFHGSMGHVRLNRPVSGIVPGEDGYLMVGEDGGIFNFGDVPFHGSLGADPPDFPVVSVALVVP